MSKQRRQILAGLLLGLAGFAQAESSEQDLTYADLAYDPLVRTVQAPPPPALGAVAPSVGAMPPAGGAAPSQAADGTARRRRSSRGADKPVVFLLGDQLPPPPPIPPNPQQPSALLPSVRGFKISENQSPRPEDRVFYSFNYFANVNGAINDALDTPVTNLRAYRHVFGFEKTFDEARGSFGLRFPIHTLVADNRMQANFTQFGGTYQAPGNLTAFTKYILKENPETGSLFSVGFAITPPTGPRTFAGFPTTSNIKTTFFQPFIGYLVNFDRWFLHGFSAFDFPADNREVTLIYNDVGVGYFLYQAQDTERLLSAVVPTFEVHVNTPLNHRNPFLADDPTGTPNVVNLTYGVNFLFRRNAVLTFGWVNPVTTPKPFDYEALLLFNLRFGGRRTRVPATTPMLGG